LGRKVELLLEPEPSEERFAVAAELLLVAAPPERGVYVVTPFEVVTPECGASVLVEFVAE